MSASKKRVIKSLDTLSEDLRELIKRQYPAGYESNITRIASPKKEPIFVFSLETADTTYLVKVPVTKNSDGEYDVEKQGKGDFEGDGDNFGDDDDFGDGDDSNDGQDDFDEEGGGSGTKASGEASYDPDFDN
jgi:hypothetical protein